jgi:hypothetical protein
MLEAQLAITMLGIGLAGLCPFVVMQLRQMVNLESRFMAREYTFQRIGGVPTTEPYWPPASYYSSPLFLQSGRLAPHPPSYYYYIVPWNNPWAQKLTTRAQLLTTSSNTSDPAITSRPAGFPHVTQPQAVSLTLDNNGNVTAVTAVVQVN